MILKPKTVRVAFRMLAPFLAMSWGPWRLLCSTGQLCREPGCAHLSPMFADYASLKIWVIIVPPLDLDNRSLDTRYGSVLYANDVSYAIFCCSCSAVLYRASHSAASLVVLTALSSDSLGECSTHRCQSPDSVHNRSL